ncbi:MAG: ribonuclease G [Rhodanobacteraceae bacterium]|nr:ribonuclease G [Rhodanobacteraceae bacterium]
MSEEILINVTPRETRVAVVENGMLQEVHIERAQRRGYVGNIYKGKVSRVMPGMQAAFVEIGLERAAFLHASDIVRAAPSLVGDATAEGSNPSGPTPPILDLVREGHELVVQVVKDPIGSKGARLTTHLSIPSRYLVLLPYSRMVGVSVRIEDEAERARLKESLQQLGRDGSLGFIVRTNAEGQTHEALAEDVDYLGRLWQAVQEGISQARVGTRIYEDLPLSLRALRDLMRRDIEKVRVDSRETFDKIHSFTQQFMPELVERIEHYPGERPIFDLYGVEDEIQRALRKEVPLKSGGYLIVDQTEAMTTVDVNTGAFLGHRNLEETVYRTNLEAAQAAARQLRLRNLGGIIIIDFIDMTDEEHKRQVLRTLEKALARDHAKTTVYDMSPLGLVEMTRKRTTESLERQLCEPCHECGGRGSLKTAETVTYEIFREITRAVRQFDAEKLLVLAAPKVVSRILDEESAAVAELEEFIRKTIRFQPEEHYSQEQFDVVLL